MQAYLYLAVNILVTPQEKSSDFYAIPVCIKASEKPGKQKKNKNILPIIFYLPRLSRVWGP